MPAVTQLVVNDGQATPVAHTFKPDGKKGEVLFFADRSGGIPVGYGKISFNRRETSGNGSGSYKVTMKIVVPTLEQTSASTATGIQPAPTVAYKHEVNIEFSMPARGSVANRKDILAYAKNLLATADVQAVIHDLEDLYV
jgi:hypothetical protein